jgi:hypothetical protein
VGGLIGYEVARGVSASNHFSRMTNTLRLLSVAKESSPYFTT